MKNGNQAEPSGYLTDVYQRYSQIKCWSGRFTFSEDEREYFELEFKGIDLKGRRVLEIGFGAGAFVAWAMTKGATVSGVEIDPDSLHAAQEYGLDTLSSDLEGIANQYQEVFDLIVALDVFEHFQLDDVFARVRALEVMLKRGGRAVLRFPNSQSPFGQAPQNGDVTHLTPLSGDKFRQIIHGSTLAVDRYGGAARIRGRRPIKWLGRTCRYLIQDLIDATLNFTYPPRKPLAPVVTLVLIKVAPSL